MILVNPKEFIKRFHNQSPIDGIYQSWFIEIVSTSSYHTHKSKDIQCWEFFAENYLILENLNLSRKVLNASKQKVSILFNYSINRPIIIAYSYFQGKQFINMNIACIYCTNGLFFKFSVVYIKIPSCQLKWFVVLSSLNTNPLVNKIMIMPSYHKPIIVFIIKIRIFYEKIARTKLCKILKIYRRICFTSSLKIDFLVNSIMIMPSYHKPIIAFIIKIGFL